METSSQTTVAEAASEDATAIRIEGARKTYASLGQPHRDAVREVTFQVRSGEVHGLLGPNGAGKTTTLKMLLGLVRPTSGVFEILGVPAGPAVRAKVGFLAEQPYFSPLLTAAQTLALHGRLSGMSRAAVGARVDELLSRVGLAGKGDVVLAKFSRGMLQRLGIATAIVHQPYVVVLDEPASGLDPVGQRDVRNLMLELRESGATVLLSSHQLSEVEAVCDRVTILDRGRVAAAGRIDELLNIAGQTSFRVSGDDDMLPEGVRERVVDVAFSGGTHMFSVADSDARRVFDALDDAGWRVLSVSPKRETLEDYFARLLDSSYEEVGE
ncbi:MAG: ABC transporter ATP-binding protein [Coriobacteriia bacterium]|nr:ABC transporter ATP-binding protein [Coriobacteriia bacterium]